MNGICWFYNVYKVFENGLLLSPSVGKTIVQWNCFSRWKPNPRGTKYSIIFNYISKVCYLLTDIGCNELKISKDNKSWVQTQMQRQTPNWQVSYDVHMILIFCLLDNFKVIQKKSYLIKYGDCWNEKELSNYKTISLIKRLWSLLSVAMIPALHNC